MTFHAQMIYSVAYKLVFRILKNQFHIYSNRKYIVHYKANNHLN